MISGRLPRITRGLRRGQVQRKPLDAMFLAEFLPLLVLEYETRVAVKMHNTFFKKHGSDHRDAIYAGLSLGPCLAWHPLCAFPQLQAVQSFAREDDARCEMKARDVSESRGSQDER